jgi:hypothetical protein
MLKPIKSLLVDKNPIRLALRRRRQGRILFRWESQGRPVPPPPIVKHGLIKSYAKRFGCRYLVETGTWHGDTVEASLNTFDKIWTIELAPHFAEVARQRFAGNAKVHILEGDSAQLLRTVIPKLDQPTLFWLDGHYSGGATAKGSVECPIYQELEAFFAGRPDRDVILIDDARDFVGARDYPTIGELRDHVRSKSKDLELYVADDVIRIHQIESRG